MKRTKCAIKQRARKLDIAYIFNCWTEEEDEILRQYYPIEGGDIYKRFHNKTKQQCVSHASRLGVTSTQKWTEEEDEIIRKYYPTEGKRGCSKHLSNRTPKSCEYRAKILGVKSIVRKNCPKRILCIETKEEFESIAQAANKYGFGISDYLRGKQKSAGQLPDGTKLHWKYVDEDEN